MGIEVTVKKWGNSMGVILPKDFISHQNINEDDKIIIEIVKKADLTHLFGSLKRKMSGQEFKDMVRTGWEK